MLKDGASAAAIELCFESMYGFFMAPQHYLPNGANLAIDNEDVNKS
jgi:hypothetical protein